MLLWVIERQNGQIATQHDDKLDTKKSEEKVNKYHEANCVNYPRREGRRKKNAPRRAERKEGKVWKANPAQITKMCIMLYDIRTILLERRIRWEFPLPPLSSSRHRPSAFLLSLRDGCEMKNWQVGGGETHSGSIIVDERRRKPPHRASHSRWLQSNGDMIFMAFSPTQFPLAFCLTQRGIPREGKM